MKRTVLGLVAVGTVVGATAVLWRWRRRSAPADADHSARPRGAGCPARVPGDAQRPARPARHAARAVATPSTGPAGCSASAERPKGCDTAFELRTASQVAESLGHMKGALMKLGQMASYLDAGLPEPVREALGQLQQDAPPMSAELVHEQVARELGGPPTTVFAEWDDVPIASASIGQVHRAMTHEGEAVAVKVQYPGVDEAIRSDLSNVDFLFNAMGVLFPGMEPEPIVEELAARALEELDYRTEAANQRYFADYYEDHPFIHVPRVVDRHSTGRVLTTELADGARFDEMLTWSEHERNLAAESLYRFAFGSIYRLNVFNGDPHPGNYLFRPGGRVTYLDFGLVKHFEDEVPIFMEMIEAMVIDRDVRRFREIVERVGVLRPGLPVTDEAIEDYFGHFYEFVSEDREVRITEEYASESVRRFFDPGGAHGEIMKAANLPPGFVIVQRINLGLYAIFARMGATANWRRIAEELWPTVERAPSTALGREDAAWVAARSGATG
ncbi:MAG: AarF/ABC1/UbiB kinase family protein [Acidimicrobiia bacterium]|nr:AarF/ABC1/UbiB kinase family protein [Acidimicrobiia bacterium]